MKFHEDYKHLGAATDADAMRARFEEALGNTSGAPVTLEQFSVPRVFPRNDGGFTIQYRTRIRRGRDDDWNTLVLCGRLLNSSEAWPAWVEDNHDKTFIMEDLRLVVPVFPFDPVLKNLDLLCTSGKTPRVVKDCARALDPKAGDPTTTDCRILGYRMERRCVVMHTLSGKENGGGTRRVIVKILKPRRARASERISAMLTANGFGAGADDGITVPRLLPVHGQEGIQCMEFVRGKSLHDLTGDRNFENACVGAARALRKLHTTPAAGMPEHTVENELEQLRSWVLLGGKIFPQWVADFEASYDAVASGPPGVCEPDGRVCIHRDFYDKQVLFSDDRTTLLDLDNMALGDPAQDYGNFAAHLILRGAQEPTRVETILGGKRAFEETYGTGDTRFEARARWWQASTLLRLAILYALRPRWRHLVPRLIEETMAKQTGRKV